MFVLADTVLAGAVCGDTLAHSDAAGRSAGILAAVPSYLYHVGLYVVDFFLVAKHEF